MARNRRSMFRRVFRSILQCFCFLRKDHDTEIIHDTNDTKETSEPSTPNNVTFCINYTINNIESVKIEQFSGGKRKSKLGYRAAHEESRLRRDSYEIDDEDDFFSFPKRNHEKQNNRAIYGRSPTKPGKDVSDYGGRRRQPSLDDSDDVIVITPQGSSNNADRETPIPDTFHSIIDSVDAGVLEEDIGHERFEQYSLTYPDIFEEVTKIGTTNYENDDTNQNEVFDVLKPSSIEHEIVQAGANGYVSPNDNDSSSNLPSYQSQMILTVEQLLNCCEDPSSAKEISEETVSVVATNSSPITVHSDELQPQQKLDLVDKLLSPLNDKSPILYDYTANGIQKAVPCFPSQFQSNSILIQNVTSKVNEIDEDNGTRMIICENHREEITEIVSEDSIKDVPSLQVPPEQEKEEVIKKPNRQRSEVPYKERNKIAARKYRLKVREGTKILNKIKSELKDTQRQFEKKKKLIALAVPCFIDNLLGDCENEEQEVEKIFNLVLSHLNNAAENQSPEGEETLFRDHIMPTLLLKYPLLHERVKKKMTEEITSTAKKQKR